MSLMDMSLLKTGRRPSSGVDGGGVWLGETEGDIPKNEDTETAGERDNGEDPVGVDGKEALVDGGVGGPWLLALTSSALWTK